MATINDRPGRRFGWLWLAVIALLFLAFFAWLLDPLGWADEATPPPARPAPTAQWTTTPEGPAVPVDLPDVPVKRVDGNGGQ